MSVELEVTSEDQREAWRSGSMPPIELVTEGIWTIPIPVPENPIRYTLCYVVEGDSSLLVIDPGWDSPEGWSALNRGFDKSGHQLSSVRGVILTHSHRDHHGLSRLVSAASGAWIAMTGFEEEFLINSPSDADRWQAQEIAWMVNSGVPDEFHPTMIFPIERIHGNLEMVRPDMVVTDGEMVDLPGRRIRAVVTPGHTSGHLCLFDEEANVLITGDHVLPRITPHVGMHARVVDSPLQNYLESLERMLEFGTAEVLPGHEWRFKGLDTRVRQIQQHHIDRSDEVVQILSERGPLEPWVVAEQLTWSREWETLKPLAHRSALAETLAHLSYLVDKGEVLRSSTSDVVRYSL